MKANVYRSAAQVTVFSTFEKALSFVYRIILSRTIGPEGLGLYTICLSLFSVFLTAASSGIPVTVSRLMAKHNVTGNVRLKHAVVTSGVICTLIFTVPAAAVLFFARGAYAFLFPGSEGADLFVWLLPGLVMTSVYAVMRGSFWGNRQFLPYSVIELLENAVMVVCGCLLIGLASTPYGGAEMAVIAVLVSYTFSFAVSLIWYFVSGGRFAKPGSQFKPLVAASLPITAMRTSTSILNSCVAVLLPALLVAQCGYPESEAVAIYGVVAGMSVPILFIPGSLIGSIAVVVAPEMSENFYSGRADLLKRDVERTVKTSVLIAALLIPALFVLGEDLGLLLYANALSGRIIRRYSFTLFPMCISMITTTILNSMHFEVKTLIYYFAGAAAMLACIFAFTPLIGIDAYLAGIAASFVITAALNLRLLNKNCRGVNYWGYLFKCVGACALSCVFGRLLNNLTAPLGHLVKILVCGPAIFLFCLGLLSATDLITLRPVRRLFSR